VGQDVNALLANPTDPAWSGYSIEFCGGTHLTNTTQAEDFVIVEESGIAKVSALFLLSGTTLLALRRVPSFTLALRYRRSSVLT
jgi:alanyl-tRNA synthetase